MLTIARGHGYTEAWGHDCVEEAWGCDYAGVSLESQLHRGAQGLG
jgi:hypothetical protein